MTSAPNALVDGKILRRVEWALFVLFSALFVYTVLEWRGILGDEHPFQPVRMVVLGGALLCQSAGGIVRNRSRGLSYALMIVSLIALGLTFLIHG